MLLRLVKNNVGDASGILNLGDLFQGRVETPEFWGSLGALLQEEQKMQQQKAEKRLLDLLLWCLLLRVVN